MVDEVLVVFVFGSGWRFRHNRFKCTLVDCEDGAEAGEGAETGVKEDQEVDCQG